MSQIKTKSKSKFKCPLKASNQLNVNSIVNQLAINDINDSEDKQLVHKSVKNKNSFAFETANGKRIKISDEKILRIKTNLWAEEESVKFEAEDNSSCGHNDNQLVPSLTQDIGIDKSSVDYSGKSGNDSLKAKSNHISKSSDDRNTLESNRKKRLSFEPYISGPDNKNK